MTNRPPTVLLWIQHAHITETYYLALPTKMFTQNELKPTWPRHAMISPLDQFNRGNV